MKILFDECMPQPLRRRLAEFEISTAQEMGWGRVKNGELLKRAEGVFAAFVTSDQQLKYQQNLTGRRLAILVLSTNRWPVVKAKTPEIVAAIQALHPGDYVELTLWFFEMKTDEFDLIEQAVKTSTAPAEIVAAFNELSALREQLKNPSSRLLSGGAGVSVFSLVNRREISFGV